MISISQGTGGRGGEELVKMRVDGSRTETLILIYHNEPPMEYFENVQMKIKCTK